MGPLMIIASWSSISRCGYYVLVSKYGSDLWMYVALVVGLFSGFQPVINRSSLCRALPQDEIGSVFAVMQVLVAVGPSLMTPLGSAIYNATLRHNPGMWTLLPLGILLVQFPLYLTLHTLYILQNNSFS